MFYKKLINKYFVLLLLSILFGCATNVWSPKISNETKLALTHYNEKKVLSNGHIYGQFARVLDLRKKSAQEINSLAQKHSCQRLDGYIKDWKTKKNLIYKGKNIPMIFFVCPDGSVVRIKPKGNPLDKFRKWPHASKAVRFPPNGDPKDFTMESFKVNNQGKAIPKWSRDLSKDIDPDVWANDAHTDFLPR